MRLLEEFGLLSSFIKLISGCIDTLKLARKVYPKSEVKNYNKTTLVKMLLGIDYDAQMPLRMLKVCTNYLMRSFFSHWKDTFSFHVSKLEASYAPLLVEKKMSKAMVRRLANSGLAFKRDQNHGVKREFSF